MPEEDTIIKSSVKHKGFFTFADLYRFAYDWLKDETGLDVTEDKYGEKLAGNEKEIDVEWTGEKKLTDYFKIKVKVEFEIKKLKEVEIQQEGKKIKTNQGDVKITAKGILIKDYDGKFERTAFRKFLRSVYERWIITSRVDQFEDKVFEDVDEFLAQIKAWLALEGKR